MLIFPPIAWPESAPVPLDAASLYGAETQVVDLKDAMCPGFDDECKRTCLRNSFAAVDDMGSFCDARRGGK